MLIEDIREKIRHNSQNTCDSMDKFQLSRGVLVRSAMIYKNHGKTDKETVAMLKKDFMLDEKQTRLIMDGMS